MLFLQTIIKNVLMTWQVAVWFKVVQHVWLKEDFYTSLEVSLHTFCTTVDLHRGHSDQLSHHLHALHSHALKNKQTNKRKKLSLNIFKQTLGDCMCKDKKVHRKYRHLVFSNGQQEPKRTIWILFKTFRSHRFLFSLSFHAGLSQNNNLCNILSQSVHSNSVMATSI